MATKPAQSEVLLNVEEALDLIDKTMDRVKSLYEQYFLGIQKQPPTFIHSDLERKLRDLAQVQIRNTALRYRYATLQQKFSSYNSYWRRTLRQIENGSYTRSLAKLGRKSVETGEDIPEEILAKMPKRMREAVKRDREQARSLAARRKVASGESAEAPSVPADAGEFYEEFSKPAPGKVNSRGAHLLDEGDVDLDLDKFFAAVEEDEPTQSGPPPQAIPPTPSAPANQRSAMLGGMPRAQSPALRTSPTPQPFAPQSTPPAAQPLGSAFAKTQPMPAVTPPAMTPTGQRPVVPPVIPSRTQAVPVRASQPVVPGQLPPVPAPGSRPSQPVLPPLPSPGVPRPATEPLRTQPMPTLQRPPGAAPSQVSRPNPIAPGASANKSVPVESMSGPFAREPSVAVPRRQKRDTDIDQGIEVPQAPTPPPSAPMRATPTPQPMRAMSTPSRPSAPIARTASQPAQPRPKPPGMSDADVDSLYQKYVKAKEMVGEQTNAQTYGKLLNTINAQAPKIMEQYKAKGVDFSVVVKDNQVIIKAKPKP